VSVAYRARRVVPLELRRVRPDLDFAFLDVPRPVARATSVVIGAVSRLSGPVFLLRFVLLAIPISLVMVRRLVVVPTGGVAAFRCVGRPTGRRGRPSPA
jgi:hypothetical protein